MLEKIRENKRLVIILVVGLLLLLTVIVLLVVLSSPGAPSDDTTNGGNVSSPPVINDPGGDTNSDGGTDADGGDTASGDDITITWWGVFLSEEDVEPLIIAYEADNPGVKVNFVNQVLRSSELVGYQAKLDDVLANGSTQAPDLIMIDNGWAGLFRDELAPSPDDIVSPSQVGSDFYDFVQTDFVVDGKVYGLPLWVDTFAFVYNKKIYEDAGLVSPESDWQKFVDEQIPVLTEKDGSDNITTAGFSGADSTNTEFWFEALNILMLQNGSEIISADGKSALAGNTDAQDAVDFYKQFTGTDATWSSDFNLDAAAFLEGKLATYMAPTWRLNDIVRYNNAGNLGLDIGVSAIPQLAGSDSGSSNMAVYWANAVNSDSANSDAVWQFNNYLTQSAQLEQLNSTVTGNGRSEIGLLYPRKDMETLQSNDLYLGVYSGSLRNARSWYMVDKIAIKDIYEGILVDNDDLGSIDTEANKVL